MCFFLVFFINFQTAGQLKEQEGSVGLLAGAVIANLDLRVFFLFVRQCAQHLGQSKPLDWI